MVEQSVVSLSVMMALKRVDCWDRGLADELADSWGDGWVAWLVASKARDLVVA
jgi:hypothetical protein